MRICSYEEEEEEEDVDKKMNKKRKREGGWLRNVNIYRDVL